jgi:hypothetical protein
MGKLTINGRVYPAKELDFNFLCELGNEKIDIAEIDVKLMPAIRVYVAWCMGTDVETAGEEINKYVINGGDIKEIATVFSKMGEESGFFRAIQQNNEETSEENTEETPKKRTKKEQTTSE